MAVAEDREDQGLSPEMRKIMGTLLRRRRMESGPGGLKDIDTDEIRRRWRSEQKKSRPRSL